MDLSLTTRRNAVVLLAVREAGETYGAEIAKAVSMPRRAVYRSLHQLAEGGYLLAWDEDDSAFDRGRPPRRYYRLTEDAKPIVESLHGLYRLYATAPEGQADAP